MFTRIIVGFDGSPESYGALRLADTLGGDGATVLVVHVAPWAAFDTPSYAVPAADPAAVGDLMEAGRRVFSADKAVRCTITEGGSVASEVHRISRDEDADLIVVGSSRHHGAGRALLGSNTEAVLLDAPAAVAIARATPSAGLARVGVAFDGTLSGWSVVRRAGAIARDRAASLTVLGVVDTRHAYATFGDEGGYGDLREPAREMLRSVVASVDGVPDLREELREGDPVREIVELSHEVDLLVVGAKPAGLVLRLLLGGVSGRVVRRGACPVLILPAHTRAGLGERRSVSAH